MLAGIWNKRIAHQFLVGVQTLQPLWKSVQWFLRKMGLNLPEDPAIQLLGIYPKDASSCHTDNSSIVIVAIFVIVRN